MNLTTEKTADVFFAVAPNGVAVKSVKVTLKTEDGNYEKEVTVPEKTFKSGVVSAFTVDMTGASKVQDKVFKLVKNVANLAAGDQVIIANKAATSAISTTQQGNNRKGAAITPDASGDIVNPSDAVQILTVAEGVTTGTFAFSPEAGKYLYAVKGSISQKSLRIDQRMLPEEILKQGKKEPCITNGLVFIRSVGFLVTLDLWMRGKVIVIIKIDSADNAQTIRQDTGFVSITEMSVEVLLFDLLIGGSMSWHRTISRLVGIEVFQAHSICPYS